MKRRALLWAAVSTRPQANEDEKFSIPKQIDDGQQFAEKNDLQIIDTLIVPGHSRSYRTLDSLAQHARQQGIDAFDRLIEHLERKDFDIFICRDANRFARTASLLHYIAESIVEDAGAVIYSQNDGLWVNNENVDMWATMKGYAVRSEVKWLVSATRDGLKKRAERGLTTTRVPFSHVVVRDERLKPIRIEPDETKRRLFDDLYTLIVEERTPFNGIERILFERFGHVAKDGKPYGDNVMYHFLYHPLTWGISTYGYYRKGQRIMSGAWVLDETQAAPEGIEIHRDTVASVYSGAQADNLRLELLRRKEMIGKRRPDFTYAYSGLFVCKVCFYTLGVVTNPNVKTGRKASSLRCNSHINNFQFRPPCDQKEVVHIHYIETYLKDWLRQLIERRDWSMLIAEHDDSGAQLERAEAEAADLAEKLDNLIVIQANAAKAAQAAYQRQIDSMAERLEILERDTRLRRSQQERQQRERERSSAALDKIAAFGEDFWSLPEPVINQQLLALLGSRRFAVQDGKIQGTILKPPRQSRR